MADKTIHGDVDIQGQLTINTIPVGASIISKTILLDGYMDAPIELLDGQYFISVNMDDPAGEGFTIELFSLSGSSRGAVYKEWHMEDRGAGDTSTLFFTVLSDPIDSTRKNIKWDLFEFDGTLDSDASSILLRNNCKLAIDGLNETRAPVHIKIVHQAF